MMWNQKEEEPMQLTDLGGCSGMLAHRIVPSGSPVYLLPVLFLSGLLGHLGHFVVPLLFHCLLVAQLLSLCHLFFLRFFLAHYRLFLLDDRLFCALSPEVVPLVRVWCAERRADLAEGCETEQWSSHRSRVAVLKRGLAAER
mmetsp:Transcript_10745/g.32981  ORF Transcript_10745/g.32981 Transcript_10745/m.32981 type:complete len:142 (+) Transcript_10745:142-567(+)